MERESQDYHFHCPLCRPPAHPFPNSDTYQPDLVSDDDGVRPDQAYDQRDAFTNNDVDTTSWMDTSDSARLDVAGNDLAMTDEAHFEPERMLAQHHFSCVCPSTCNMSMSNTDPNTERSLSVNDGNVGRFSAEYHPCVHANPSWDQTSAHGQNSHGTGQPNASIDARLSYNGPTLAFDQHQQGATTTNPLLRDVQESEYPDWTIPLYSDSWSSVNTRKIQGDMNAVSPRETQIGLPAEFQWNVTEEASYQPTDGGYQTQGSYSSAFDQCKGSLFVPAASSLSGESSPASISSPISIPSSWRSNASSSAPQDLSCDEPDCDVVFTGQHGKGNLARHKRLVHRAPPGAIVCEDPHCERRFNRSDARLKHYRKYHPHLAPNPIERRPNQGSRSDP